MRRLLPLILFASIVTALGCVTRSSSEIQPPQPATVNSSQTPSPGATPCLLPVPATYVSDQANVLDQAARDQLERKLQEFKTRGNIDFSVLFIGTTGSRDIDSYSLDLARCWGVGAKNPDGAGVLLLIAVNDRKWRIQISKVLEKLITNPEVYDIGNLMTPDFKRANYAAGVNKAVDAIIEVLAKQRNLSVT